MHEDPRQAELARLKAQVSALEHEMSGSATPVADWTPKGYYTTYHILAGMVLGLAAAAASLVFNVVGAAMVGRHPLELIRVYLTFPMGAKALTLQADQDGGFLLAAGCCLYLVTGMFGGIPFHLILSRFFGNAPFGKRFVVTTILAIGVWLVNFYGLIAWIQPLLIGGKWILEQIPVYVAIATHVVFGWTMLAMDSWGRFVPHRTAMEGSAR